MPDLPAAMVVFLLDGQRYGLALESVERVVRLVAVTGLPSAPEIVTGVIGYRGGVAPVVDLRRRFRLQERQSELDDHIIVARSRRRRVAMTVDAVTGVEPIGTGDWVAPETVLPCTEYLAGIVKRRDGLILIHDLDTFLSLDEEQALDGALSVVDP